MDEPIRIEFQNRGSPHAHCVLWVKNAPRFGEQPDSQVCKFIDKYISCSIPSEEGRLKDLVLALQKHKHSTYCKRSGRCRFSFPHPPSYETLISKPGDSNEIETALKNLTKVRKVLLHGDTDVSLDTLLQNASVSLVTIRKHWP